MGAVRNETKIATFPLAEGALGSLPRPFASTHWAGPTSEPSGLSPPWVRGLPVPEVEPGVDVEAPTVAQPRGAWGSVSAVIFRASPSNRAGSPWYSMPDYGHDCRLPRNPLLHRPGAVGAAPGLRHSDKIHGARAHDSESKELFALAERGRHSDRSEAKWRNLQLATSQISRLPAVPSTALRASSSN